MLQKIAPYSVQRGMFIVGFGGGWFDHPFWRKRFRVESAADLARIRACKVPYVLIDPARGIAAQSDPAQSDPAQPNQAHPDPAGPTPSVSPGNLQQRARPRRPGRGQGLGKPALATPGHRRARAMVSRAGERIRSVFDQLDLGWRIDHRVIDAVFEDIEREVVENTDALLAVIGLKTKDDYTYLHSVAVCALMVCLARERGLPAQEVRDLGKAGLLHDIGKIRVADEILKKSGRLTDDEYRVAQGHARDGFEILGDVPDIPPSALDVCLHHHEKMDGTGYPDGLAGEEISHAARLAAVCDVFDALTSTRPYKQRWSRDQAIAAMWSWTGHFDPAVLADLMRVTRIYPPGLLVRLANGHLALTLNPEPGEGGLCVAEFFLPRRMEWAGPSRRVIARGDLADAIVGLERPDEWGFEDWQTVRAQIEAALASGACPAAPHALALSA